MTDKQPEALRLAVLCDAEQVATVHRDILMHESAAELRRLCAIEVEHVKLGRDYQDAWDSRDRLLAENKQLKATQYGSGRLQALRTQRDELLESAKHLQGWIEVLLHTLGAEMDDFEVVASNSKTGASVTINLKEHFDEASAAIAKATQEAA